MSGYRVRPFLRKNDFTNVTSVSKCKAKTKILLCKYNDYTTNKFLLGKICSIEYNKRLLDTTDATFNF